MDADKFIHALNKTAGLFGTLLALLVLAPDATEAVRKDAARKFLGFLPVSADGTAYRYDARLGEVANARHGSHRRPERHGRVAEGSELGKFLDLIKGLYPVWAIERH